MKRRMTIVLSLIGLALLISGVAFAGLVALRLSEAEPPHPSDIPSNLTSANLAELASNSSASNAGGASIRLDPPQLIGNGTLPVSHGQTFFIVPYGREINLTVYFDDIQTFRGQMEGNNATLTIVSPNVTSEPATTMNERVSFTNVNVPAKEQEIPTSPWIKAPLVLNEGQNRSWVVASAEVNVKYYTIGPAGPAKLNQVLFESWQHLKRNITFFVISPQEYYELLEHNDWAYISFGFGTPKVDRSVVVLEYSTCAFIGIIGGGALLYQIYGRK